MYRHIFMAVSAVLLLGGCSIKRMAVNSVGDSLATGPSVYESDDDIQLVGDALPFSLKFIETLLASSPNNPNIKLAACKGYALYAYVYIQQEAEMNAEDDMAKRQEATVRARHLLLRGLGYGLSALENQHPGFSKDVTTDPKAACRHVTRSELPILYWSAAALGLAISASRGEAEMIARLPEVDAMLEQCLKLDEAWEAGTLHEFALVLAGSRPAGGSPADPGMKAHYDLALRESGGNRASLFVAWAEAVDIKTQNKREFREMLQKAMEVNADAAPNLKLANAVAKRRAKWLLLREDRFFIDDEPQGGATQ